MPKSKHRKNHKQKVAARKLRLEEEKKRLQKAQREFINKLIKEEQEKGLFNSTKSIEPIDSNQGTSIDIEGPLI
jgi:ribosomal protein S3AE